MTATATPPPLWAADHRCSICGYGVAQASPPRRCPMCGGDENTWVTTPGTGLA